MKSVSWPDYEDEEVVSWEECSCVGETKMAIKVIGIGDQPVWIPKSQIHNDSEVYNDHTDGTLVVKRWFAEKEGWI